MRGSSSAEPRRLFLVCVSNFKSNSQRAAMGEAAALSAVHPGAIPAPTPPQCWDTQGAGLVPFIPTFDLETKLRSLLAAALGFAVLWARGEGIPQHAQRMRMGSQSGAVATSRGTDLCWRNNVWIGAAHALPLILCLPPRSAALSSLPHFGRINLR